MHYHRLLLFKHKKEGTIIVTITFVTATPPQKKMTMHYRHLLVFKHKEEGGGNNYHRLHRCNTSTKEDDNELLSSSSFQTQQRRQR